MVIISQDKTMILNFENIETIEIVLQEIINKFKITLYNSKTNETVVNVPKVYEMPTK